MIPYDGSNRQMSTPGDPGLFGGLQFVYVEDPMAELASCYYSLGDCYNRLHDGFKSMSAFASGIALNKYYRDNYFGLGVLLIANEMYDMAIGVLEEGLKTSQRAYS
jgi:tetratricopeptide (TPR) repeat protein